MTPQFTPEPGTTGAAMIALSGVSKHFTKAVGPVTTLTRRFAAKSPTETAIAVDSVDLEVRSGEVVGLVGESGCGKTTLGRIAAGLLGPTSGKVLLKGKDTAALSRGDRNRMWLRAQLIFQDPMSALNPKLPVGRAIGEAPRYHRLVRRKEIDGYVAGLMDEVGLDPRLADRLPHQLSGGQRARINIARALAVRPEFLVCDESVAALDVSIQAQIINLFLQLRQDLRLTYLFISHNLGVVEHIADRVVIMYLGRVVEQAPADELFSHPNHPYARALLNEVPRIGVGKKTFNPITGEIPSPFSPPAGCHFHPRCPHAFERCRLEVPKLKPIAGSNHLSACHLNDIN